MIVKNVKVFTENRTFKDGEVFIRDGLFCEKMEDKEVLDGEGCYAIPGLIDLHFHGCMGYDFCDGTKEAIAEIAKYEASIGVTAIAPATMTLAVEELERILTVATEYKKEIENSIVSNGAELVGINMEGPFISKEKRGAQDERNIIPCDVSICQRFLDVSEGLVKFIGIAPEENEESLTFIEQVKDKVNVSLAHTNADYDIAKAAFTTGANHAVHLYNAMTPFNHRIPGVIGAVFDSEHVTAEIITDGIHVHPSMVRATFKMLGDHRVILVSDSMRATGMPDGQYMLGGLAVDVKGNRATLVSNGAIAGSTTNLMECMKIAVKEMGISLETAIACATMNPAKRLGIYQEHGSISVGKKANLVLLNKELEVKAVIKDGCLLR